MNREAALLRRIRLLTWFFIAGLVASGATAMPLTAEVTWLTRVVGASGHPSVLADWLQRIHLALNETQARYPFLFYGTDWLAFGHFVIAIAFIGALKDPVRNRWLFDFGLIACALVIPFALVMGEVRGIPLWWRLIDCSFGIFGAVPLWLCRRWAMKVEQCRPQPFDADVTKG